jgi:anti-anti-sigma factor
VEAECGYDVARFDDRVIIAIRGEVAAPTAPDLARDLLALLDRRLREVVLDLNFCTLIDQLGAETFVRLRDEIQANGAHVRFTSIPRASEVLLRAHGL